MKWFHHDTDMHRNRKIRKLIRVHGATGFAFWCLLLERLYAQENEFSIPADDLWFEDISEDLRLSDYRTPIRILDTLSELHLIDSQLWQEHVIYAPSIAERGDQYIVKRVQETEKKRRHRARKKELSLVDTQGTKGQTVVLSPSDTDPYSDPEANTDPDPDPELKPINTKPIQEREEADSIALDSVFAVECRATQEELPLVSRDPESEADLVKKTGGRKPKKTPCSEGDFEAFREIYNDRKPDMWAEMQIVNPSRQKILNQLAIDCDGKENAIAALANALDYARQDQWYLTKALSFENFATNNKILRLHEQQVARSPRKDEAVRFASNPANLKALQNRSSFQKAREMIENGY